MLDIKINYDLSKNSTLRVQARAEYYAEPSSHEDLLDLFNFIKSKNLTWNILGAGSNVLLSSRAIKGCLICTNKLDFIHRLNETDYEFGVGLRMPRLCAIVSKEALSGAEFMEGIPGSVGGGIVMNAGAHHSEISNILYGVQIFDIAKMQLQFWDKDKLNLAYRSSSINPGEYLIYSGYFRFKPELKEVIREKIQSNNHARTSKQPIKAFTCGCTFKNPEPQISAGKLIEDLGLKGLQEGDFIVSNMHGNFFENIQSGTSMDFCKLMKRVQAEALKRGIKLKPEVQALGEFTEEEKSIWF